MKQLLIRLAIRYLRRHSPQSLHDWREESYYTRRLLESIDTRRKGR